MTGPEQQNRKRVYGILRVLFIALIVGFVWFFSKRYGLAEILSPSAVQERMGGAGLTGLLLYILAFVVGGQIQIPGVPFVVVARVAYGPLFGFAAGFLGALVSISVSFWLARGLGGKAFTKIRWAWMRRIFEQLEERPLRSMFLLRTFMILSPPVNFTVAMTGIRYRDYMLGSILGLLGPIAAITLLYDLVAAFIGPLLG